MFHIRGFELGLFRNIVPEDASVEYRMMLFNDTIMYTY
jgi:hypothetical protein